MVSCESLPLNSQLDRMTTQPAERSAVYFPLTSDLRGQLTSEVRGQLTSDLRGQLTSAKNCEKYALRVFKVTQSHQIWHQSNGHVRLRIVTNTLCFKKTGPLKRLV